MAVVLQALIFTLAALRAQGVCSPPAIGADMAAGVATYVRCLTANCEDANATFISSWTQYPADCDVIDWFWDGNCSVSLPYTLNLMMEAATNKSLSPSIAAAINHATVDNFCCARCKLPPWTPEPPATTATAKIQLLYRPRKTESPATTTSPAQGVCIPPAIGSDMNPSAAGLATYVQCLTANCEDANATFISSWTQYPADCDVIDWFWDGNCSVSLPYTLNLMMEAATNKSLSPSIAAAIKHATVDNFCGARCKLPPWTPEPPATTATAKLRLLNRPRMTESPATTTSPAQGVCIPPAIGSDMNLSAAGLATYVQCLTANCEDANATFISSWTQYPADCDVIDWFWDGNCSVSLPYTLNLMMEAATNKSLSPSIAAAIKHATVDNFCCARCKLPPWTPEPTTTTGPATTTTTATSGPTTRTATTTAATTTSRMQPRQLRHVTSACKIQGGVPIVAATLVMLALLKFF